MASHQLTPVTKCKDPDVYTEISIDKKDMANIAVAKAERDMHARLADCKVKIEELAKAIQRANKDLNNLCQHHANKYYEHAGSLIAGLNKDYTLNLKNKVEISVHDEAYLHRLVIAADGTASGVSGTLSTNYITSAFHTSEMTQLSKYMKECQAALVQKQNEAIEWKKRLGNIDMLERQAQAAITESELRKSEGGSALLDAMLNDLHDKVLSLPSY